MSSLFFKKEEFPPIVESCFLLGTLFIYPPLFVEKIYHQFFLVEIILAPPKRLLLGHTFFSTHQKNSSKGDLKTLEDYLQASSTTSIDEKDAKGISCLGYAIGANRTHVVKKLLESKAEKKIGVGRRVGYLGGGCENDMFRLRLETPCPKFKEKLEV